MSNKRDTASAEVLLLEPSDCTPPPRRFEATTATIVDMPADNRELPAVVEFADSEGVVVRHRAAATVELDPGLVGRPVMLMFLHGDPAQPVITGVMQPGSIKPKKTTRTKKLELDAKALLLTADTEITLKCGKASITLTQDGRILLRGKDLVSRASAVNRIRGGVIQLN